MVGRRADAAVPIGLLRGLSGSGLAAGDSFQTLFEICVGLFSTTSQGLDVGRGEVCALFVFLPRLETHEEGEERGTSHDHAKDEEGL